MMSKCLQAARKQLLGQLTDLLKAVFHMAVHRIGRATAHAIVRQVFEQAFPQVAQLCLRVGFSEAAVFKVSVKRLQFMLQRILRADGLTL